MNYKLLFGILILGVFLFGIVSSYTNFFCEEIDYNSPRIKYLIENTDLKPIIDFKTGQPIKYPIGCE